MSYPCNLRCKALYVILFLLEQALRNEHWHVYILYSCLFEHCIEILLYILPDGITIGFKDHASLYR